MIQPEAEPVRQAVDRTAPQVAVPAVQQPEQAEIPVKDPAVQAAIRRVVPGREVQIVWLLYRAQEI